MLFKNRRIRKLKIKIAKYKALSECSVNFIKGDTNSYFINCHLSHIAELSEAKEELAILESDT